jgi:ADP-ribose pyrophosphatase YjhB (NUDIX family)
MRIKNTEIEVVRGDIAHLKVDAVVTRQTGKRSRCVIPVLPLRCVGADGEVALRSSCKAALDKAKRLNLKSIAFPAFGCRDTCFSPLASAKIMAQEIYRYLKEDTSPLKRIVFCAADKESYAVLQKGTITYLRHILETLQGGPFVTVDAIIELKQGIVVIERSNPPFGLALPGGFVDYGESIEEAVKREVKEETDLEVTSLKQFHTYSHPRRDPRFHTVGTVFLAHVKGKPKAGDDAAGLRIIKVSDITRLTFAFDHKRILQDYLKLKRGQTPLFR